MRDRARAADDPHARARDIVGEQGRVVGIDNSQDMLLLAKQHCSELSQVHLKHCGVEKISAKNLTIENARKFGAAHTWEQTAEKILKIFEKTLAS